MHRDADEIETIAAPISVLPPARAQSPRERFPPGTLLASRYRIVSRLGKGGMGEVFRADDLILGQPVALKFLPESAKSNVGLLTRFYDEVRIARQISHKNVCRVYDIGEVDGQPYLSMEYIDGEDLGSLLRRIARLPSDKATEFARKLCAGVAAAHAEGVLHRDLKPANIMIDSRGELRVTDFGLAAIAEQLKGDEIRNGTPAYMAPEQLTGREVSVQSDLYAVGLILYEMFTGRMPFEADTVAEMTRLRQESRVTNPTTLVGDLDKTVERAILRCLEPDPRMRRLRHSRGDIVARWRSTGRRAGGWSDAVSRTGGRGRVDRSAIPKNRRAGAGGDRGRIIRVLFREPADSPGEPDSDGESAGGADVQSSRHPSRSRLCRTPRGLGREFL